MENIQNTAVSLRGGNARRRRERLHVTRISNAKIFCGDSRFRSGSLWVEDGRIRRVEFGGADARSGKEERPEGGGTVIDAAGKMVVPGYVDIHIHGANGADCSDGTAESLETVASYLLEQGVTSFLGTTMTLSERDLLRAAEAAKRKIGVPAAGCAALRGLHMEGPFFSGQKKGGQNGDFLVNPDFEMFRRIQEASGSHIRIVDVAPELPGSMEFIGKAKELCAVSIAHTAADYGTAKEAFARGASHVTHLFNAMPPFHHRAPGVVGAAVEDAAFVELICDGVHIHPSVVRTVFRLFGRGRVCIVSDAMRACGLKSGVYRLGGQDVTVRDGKATLPDGTIAGSTACIAETVRRAISFGVPPEDALCAATLTPARAAHIENEVGSLEAGKRADLLVLNDRFEPEVILQGGEIRKRK